MGRECNESQVVQRDEKVINNDVKPDNFVDEPSSFVECSVSNDNEIENGRYKRNLVFIVVPIIIAGIIILVICAANITNESIKASSDNAFTFAGLRTNNQNQETTYATIELCTLESISTKKGRLSCKKACKPAKCCYEEGRKCSFRKRKKNICENEKYEPCMVLGISEEIEKKEKDANDEKNKNLNCPKDSSSLKLNNNCEKYKNDMECAY